eukprot:363880-Chlamydomonas_euryale.AAC.1
MAPPLPFIPSTQPSVPCGARLAPGWSSAPPPPSLPAPKLPCHAGCAWHQDGRQPLLPLPSQHPIFRAMRGAPGTRMVVSPSFPIPPSTQASVPCDAHLAPGWLSALWHGRAPERPQTGRTGSPAACRLKACGSCTAPPPWSRARRATPVPCGHSRPQAFRAG